MRQTVGSDTTHYLWDELSAYGDVVRETNGTGTELASYTLADTQLLGQTRSGVTSYYLSDGQGSTRALLNGTGDLTDTYDYTAFGEIYNQTGSTLNNYLYTGQQFDSLTGLYSLRARYYDPGVGRFLSRDTYPINYQNPIELNRYGYVGNNPANVIDPTGQSGILVGYVQQNEQSVKTGVPLLTITGGVVSFIFLVILSFLNITSTETWDDPRTNPDGRDGEDNSNQNEGNEGSDQRSGSDHGPGEGTNGSSTDSTPGGTNPTSTGPTGTNPAGTGPAGTNPGGGTGSGDWWKWFWWTWWAATGGTTLSSDTATSTQTSSQTQQNNSTEQNTNNDTTTEESYDCDPHCVLRGGEAKPNDLQQGYQKHNRVPNLYGISVQYEVGILLVDLARAGAFPNSMISYASDVELITAAATIGYVITIQDSPGRGYHCTLSAYKNGSMLTQLPEDLAKKLSETFIRKIPNPYKRQ